MKAKILKVAGDVQGVSFRYFARTEAKNLDLCGWAQNEHDGSVTIFAQGTEEALEKLIKWAHDGSPMATVNEVIVSEAKVDEGIRGFEVK